MKKIEVFYQSSPEYNNIIDDFLRQFENYFKEVVSRETIINLFLSNLKKIKIINGVESFKQFPFLGYVSGVYFLSKTLKIAQKDNVYDDSVIYHEMFHALSRKPRMKRITLKRTFLSMFTGKNYISRRDFEEGMTEYLTSCIMGEEDKNTFFVYAQQTAIIYKLAKIYGDDVILEYYLGINNKLINMLNQDFHNGFKKVVKLCGLVDTNSENPLPFEPTRYYKGKKNLVSDNFLFDLFKKKKLVQIQTIDDFKMNVKQIISFYEADLYSVCSTIFKKNQLLKDAKEKNDANIIIIYQGIIDQYMSYFSKLFDILKIEWDKLNIKNDELFNNLVLNEIKEINENFFLIVNEWYQHINTNKYEKQNIINNNNKLSKNDLLQLRNYLKNEINKNNQIYDEFERNDEKGKKY